MGRGLAGGRLRGWPSGIRTGRLRRRPRLPAAGRRPLAGQAGLRLRASRDAAERAGPEAPANRRRPRRKPARAASGRRRRGALPARRQLIRRARRHALRGPLSRRRRRDRAPRCPSAAPDLTPEIAPEAAWDHPANTEHVDAIATERRLATNPLPIPPIPVRVVTAANGDSDEKDQAYWLEFSPNASQVTIDGGHDLHFDTRARIRELARSAT